MDDLFKQLKEKGYCIVYMDDILIYAESKEKLREATLEVLKIIRDNDLYLKTEKCEFYKEKVSFLGMVVEHNKVSMDPAKLKGISDWPTPTSVKEIRSFLGLCNYYRRFIEDYANRARALNNRLRKDLPFEWPDKCQLSFDDLKGCFAKEPVLMIPDPTRPFQIESDASLYATGAVLSQLDGNGDRHPCSFISKTFSPAERNYEIYDRELLAIIRALSEWRHYIQGSAHTTVVHSDHKNLTYFRSAQKLNRRQARWSLNLSEFDLQLVHVPGKKMIVSDALSRRTDHSSGNERDNEDITLLPNHLFANTIDSEPILHVLINLIDTELQEKIANAKNLDTSAAEALKLLLEDGPNTLQDDLSDWTTEDLDGKPMLFYQGKQYVPKNDQLRREIVNTFHYPITAGHPGEIATYNDIA